MSALDLRTAVEAEAPAAGLVPLVELRPPSPGQEPAPGFLARWQGKAWRVHAVLERTAVVEDAGGERQLANKRALLVDPATVTWRALPGTGLVHRGRRHTPEWRRAVREASDRRALASQDQAGQHVLEASTPSPTSPSAVEAAGAGRARARRTCSRCGRKLGGRNQGAFCTGCQRGCPECGRAKSLTAARCRRCAGAATQPKMVAPRSSTSPPAAELETETSRIPAVDKVAAPELEEQPAAAADVEPDEVALRIAVQLAQLPPQVQQLLDHLVGAYSQIQELEDELERHRETERRVLRRVHRRLRTSRVNRSGPRPTRQGEPT